MNRHLEAFLEMLVAERGAARNTLAAYQADLGDFAAFARAQGTPPEAADPALLGRYLQRLTDLGLAPRTGLNRPSL